MPATNALLTGSYDSGMVHESHGGYGAEYLKLGETSGNRMEDTSVEEDSMVAFKLVSRESGISTGHANDL